MLAQIKKIGLILPVLFLCAIPASAQLGTIQGFCDNGGNHALTSGQPSSNYLQGDIPLCTVSVFYHDSTTLAPIFMGENSTGTLNSVQVTAGGSYSVCPTGVSFSGGGGSGATATVSCTAGAVVSVAVTSPGSGYTTAPTVSFTGGTGSGATAVATIVGDLTNPFQANTDGSWRVWAAIATGYDVTMSGGIPPNNYAQPRTIANIFPNAFGGTSYTIVQANGTASAPTSPVNFINSGTVDFSITGNQVSAAVNVGSTLALKHNSSLSGILQTLYNLCDNGSCGPALDAGMQPVLAKTGSNDGSWVLETASTATQVQQLPTGLPATGQYVIIYPQAGSTSCSGGGQCSFAVGTGAWMQMSNTGTIFGAGSSVNLTGTALPAGVLDANVTAAYNCSTGYASGYGAKSIPNAALTSASISYSTYCTKVASGPGYNYAGASWQSAMSCSSGCGGQSMFSYAQPFMVVYYSGTPVTNNYLSFATPLIVQGQTVGLATGWPTVIDTGTANAYVSTAPWVTQLNPGQETILVAQNANTGASTFAFNGAPAANIVKAGGAALVSGDITVTAPALLIYQTGGTWLDLDPQTGGGSGSVTSVGMTVPSWLTVAGSPVTSSGTLAVTAAGAQAQNEVLASPNGSAGAVALRALVNGDLPTSGVTAGSYTNSNLTINAQGIVTAASNGSAGSGLPSCTSGQMVYYASSGTTGTCLGVGTNLSITGGTLNAIGGGAALTMNNSGSGAASGTTYNGSAAETISYNTVGAAPALGNCTVETANFSAAAASCYVGNAASGITATLPSISTGAIIRIQNINAGTVTASFGSSFNCTLNGSTTSGTTCAIANGSTALATTDGTSWYVTVTPTGGGSLPTATAANQPIASTGSGTIYQALTNMSMDGTNISSTGAGACPIVGTGTQICLTGAPYYASPYGATTTTGTTSGTGQTTMTVGSCSTFAPHEGVYIAGGGGTAGSTLSWNGTANINTVVSCTGTTMTLNSAIPNQVTSVTVQHDESAAFNAAFAALQPLGGTIHLPNIVTNQQGIYLVNGPLLDTSGANAILTVPKLPNYSGSNIFGNPMTVEIKGEVNDDNAVPIIESSLGTSGANILGGYDSATGGGFPNFTNVSLVLRNLMVIGPGGGSETAINGTWILGMQLYRVDVDGGNTSASWSAANGNGVLYPALADEPRVVADTVSVVGFQTCMRMGEHGEIRKLLVSTCTNGLVPDVGPIGAAQLSFANAIHVSDMWCGPQNTSTHNSTVTNCIAAGTEPTAIDFDAVSYEGAGTLVNDPSNYLSGKINYSLGLNVLPSCPYAPTLSGGANLTLYNLRCPNPTGSGTAAMFNITASVTASGCTVSSGVCTVGTATNSVTFSGIPSGYNDLIVIVNARASDSANNESLNFQFNGDTAGNYDREAMQANGTVSGTTASATSSVGVSAGFAGILIAASAPANVASFLRMEIPFYASTAFYRYVHIHSGSPITLGNGAFYANYDDVSEWKNNSSAITSIKLFDSGGGNLNVGSSFIIYGVQ